MKRINIKRVKEINWMLDELELQKRILSSKEIRLTIGSISIASVDEICSIKVDLVDVPLFQYNTLILVEARIEELEAELSEL